MEDCKQAFEKARAAYGTGAYDDATLEFLFPQLKESEEEKRVKAIEVLEKQRYFWSYEGPVDKTPPATRRKDLVEAIDVALSYLEKQKEQKPWKVGANAYFTPEQKPAEWSEEDIKKIRSEEYTKGFNDAAFGGKLKEWSVEDEDKIRQIERIAQQAGCTQKLQEEIHDWLKSLRPSWRPSEEQEPEYYQHFDPDC